MLQPAQAAIGDGTRAEQMQVMLDSPQSERRRWCQLFPMRLPNRCCKCIPVIQDWLHCVLLIGITASFTCIIAMVAELALRGECDSPVCFNRWIGGICVMPSLWYFILTVRQYDQELQGKKRTREATVQKVIDEHNRQAEKMNETCRQITDNANHFAEGQFNIRVDSFKKFLSHVNKKLLDYSDEDMVEQLKSFVLMWFRTFSGTLINPESNPVWASVERDMENLNTAKEICAYAIEKVEQHKIAFKCQVPNDAPLLSQREPSSEVEGDEDLEAGDARKCGVTWLRFHKCKKTRRLRAGQPETFAETHQALQHLNERDIRSQWRSQRLVEGFGYQRSNDASGMPVKICFLCGELRVLSRMHIGFMLLFWMDALLIFFEVAARRPFGFLLIVTNLICVISVLACFEQINEIAVLDREIHILEEQTAELVKKNDKVQKDWQQVTKLHELWKYRTLPTLCYMHKIHDHLKDKVYGEIENADLSNVDFLRFANQRLHCLNEFMGPLEDWRGREEPLDKEWVDKVGADLSELEKEQDVLIMLSKLPKPKNPLSLSPPSSSPSTSAAPSRSGSFSLPSPNETSGASSSGRRRSFT